MDEFSKCLKEEEEKKARAGEKLLQLQRLFLLILSGSGAVMTVAFSSVSSDYFTSLTRLFVDGIVYPNYG